MRFYVTLALTAVFAFFLIQSAYADTPSQVEARLNGLGLTAAELATMRDRLERDGDPVLQSDVFWAFHVLAGEPTIPDSQNHLVLGGANSPAWRHGNGDDFTDADLQVWVTWWRNANPLVTPTPIPTASPTAQPTPTAVPTPRPPLEPLPYTRPTNASYHAEQQERQEKADPERPVHPDYDADTTYIITCTLRDNGTTSCRIDRPLTPRQRMSQQ